MTTTHGTTLTLEFDVSACCSLRVLDLAGPLAIVLLLHPVYDELIGELTKCSLHRVDFVPVVISHQCVDLQVKLYFIVVIMSHITVFITF